MMSEAAGSSQAEQHDANVEGMRYHDEKLQEMLNLAKGCLRRGSLPGDQKPEKLFEKFDKEAAEREAAAANAFRDPMKEKEVAEAPRAPPPIPKTPEPSTTEERIAKVKRDLFTLERSTQSKRQELDGVNQLITKEVIDRCKAQDALRTGRSDIQKTQKAIREAKDMVRIQEKEIDELKQYIAHPATTRRASRQLAEAEAAASVNGSAQNGSVLTAADLDRAVNNYLAADPSQHLPGGPLTAAELKEVLRPSSMPAASEAKIWGHLNCENEKLASVIDAVGELSRQVNSSHGDRPARLSPGSERQLTTPDGGHDCPSKGLESGALLGMILPKPLTLPKPVLTTRPKNYKLYM